MWLSSECLMKNRLIGKAFIVPARIEIIIPDDVREFLRGKT